MQLVQTMRHFISKTLSTWCSLVQHVERNFVVVISRSPKRIRSWINRDAEQVLRTVLKTRNPWLSPFKNTCACHFSHLHSCRIR